MALLPALLLPLAACDNGSPDAYQGYIEGDYLYISSPLGGTVAKIYPQKGSCVDGGALLFDLDSEPEEASYREAESLFRSSKARFADMTKGQRPEEISVTEAAVARALADFEYSKKELMRSEALHKEHVVSQEKLDAARSAFGRDSALLEEMRARLKTARLGSREDQIAAAGSEVDRAKAVLEKAKWRLSQMKGIAPSPACVTNILYSEGEYAPPGYPVVVLLPSENIKARFFVPEPELSAVRIGQGVSVRIDSTGRPLAGTVSYISPSAEYTPPLIYSRDNREKLVFMVEASFDGADAGTLNPGQPVEVRLEKTEAIP